jgi:hypothetical protein
VFRCDPRSHTFRPLRSNLWVRRVVPRVLATRNPSTFGAPGRGLWCVFFQICFDMSDDRRHRLRLRAVYASHRRDRLQVLDGLEAIGEGAPAPGDLGFEGFAALAGPLRRATWPSRFRPKIGSCYDGTSDPVEFLQQYAAGIRSAGGDGRVMASWFMMATKGEPRRWLCQLPPRSISSWRDLCEPEDA